MRLCKSCLMVHIDAHRRTHTVRRMDFSDGSHWCEDCVEDASREPARYFIITLERAVFLHNKTEVKAPPPTTKGN